MNAYVTRRLLQVLPLLLLISLLTFLLADAAPGGPLAAYAEDPDLAPEDLARLEAQLGLAEPVWQRYGHWLARMARGDWGYSLVTHRPVMQEIGERLPRTLLLMGLSLALTLALALPLGIVAAVRQYALPDHLITLGAFVGQAVPVFWLGLLLITVFNVWLHHPVSPSQGFAWTHLWHCTDCFPLLPGGGMAPFGKTGLQLGARLRHLVLPVAVLTLVSVGTYLRFMRGQMLEVLYMDYMRTARAKGLPARRLLVPHAVKNALLPVVTVLALDLPGLFGGALFTETLFSWPGMGRLFYRSAQRVDFPMLMGIVLINAALIVFFNLGADILYAYLDPRVRYR